MTFLYRILWNLWTTTEGQDFVFTISVEGHGEYPTEKVLDNPKIKVSGVEDEGERNAWEYYVNLVYEMDQFAGDLIEGCGRKR